ncbi:P-loop NTPase fold protein [Flavobacterium sp. CFBP9031]|uniref:P-loop NTPase fold protein n=1 Tax=Flavobacterium sp. CFBP9031 TaxID=3096538 RepID=UPI002A6B04F9|nr:P-loop NTPase fold protein [Flavobacterium sp. CFBP9031]MDY0989653.1 P-loop NTPase fold protein [Flavobacterium sp. CFBP9031]
MSDKYKFSILREEVEVEDFYEDKTHEKIKNSLLNLIKNEKEGINIGLSGPWGSGKSTIINLLKKEKDFVFFYFDAWAHEGDPLRRIFLESFINCIKDIESDTEVVKKLEDKRAIISGEKRTKTTNVFRTVTKLGLFLTVSTLILSIGLALLSSVDYNTITSENTGSINKALCFGIVFSLAPFLVLFGNLIVLLCTNKKGGKLEDWSFIQNNSSETIVEDVSIDYERSSIEFEKYFKEILEIFNSVAKRKVIIVLDNLDRVEADLSLKIWSTLQTFIQHKNPNSKDYTLFKHIFTLIPYDEESLMKIWESNVEDGKGGKEIDNAFAKSFFDKSFQVRIDVPRPIVSNWLGFIDKMIEKAFINWSEEDKKVIKEVIEKTRKNILDNPKPREIKIYLNQVGFLKNHYGEDISTKSIALYSFKRYLQGKSNDEIANYLIKREEIPKEEINLIEDETIQEISAIVYGVKKDKGAQILLTPRIISALTKNKPEELKELVFNYENVFWTIFKKIILDTNQFSEYLKYSTPINDCFEEVNGEIYRNYVSLLEKYLVKNEDYNFSLDFDFCNNMKSASTLLAKYNRTEKIGTLWNFFIETYLNQENKKESQNINNLELNEIFIETLNHIFESSNRMLVNRKLNVSFESWRNMNVQSQFSNISLLIHPSDEILKQIIELIGEGIQIEEEEFLIINNCINSEVDIKLIIEPLNKHLMWNNGMQSGTVFTFESIKLFENLYYKFIGDYDFDVFFKSYYLYNVAYHVSSNNSLVVQIMSTLCSIFYKENLFNIENFVPQNHSSANSFILDIKNYWSVSSKNNAEFTYNKYRENHLLSNIWLLSQNKRNILCYDIIDLLLKNDDNKEFEIENPFFILCDIACNSPSGYNSISGIIIKFLENSNLKEELITAEDLSLTVNDYILYEILKTDNLEELYNKLEIEITKLNREDFVKSLQDGNDYLFDILFKLKEKNNRLSLGIVLNDALYEFVQSISIGSSFTISEFIKENWEDIVKLLDDVNIDNFSQRITKLLKEKRENLNDIFFEINDSFIDRPFFTSLINDDIINVRLEVQTALNSAVDIKNLKSIENLLKFENVKTIRFGNGFKELIKDSTLILLESEDENVKKIADIIAKRFSIKKK